MNRDHLPCSACSKFVPANPGIDHGHCTGFDRPARENDRPCVLFVAQGTWADRKAQMPPEHRQRPHTAETISRASAPTAAPT